MMLIKVALMLAAIIPSAVSAQEGVTAKNFGTAFEGAIVLSDWCNATEGAQVLFGDPRMFVIIPEPHGKNIRAEADKWLKTRNWDFANTPEEDFAVVVACAGNKGNMMFSAGYHNKTTGKACIAIEDGQELCNPLKAQQ